MQAADGHRTAHQQTFKSVMTHHSLASDTVSYHKEWDPQPYHCENVTSTMLSWKTETFGVRKWGKEKQHRGVVCEAGACLMAVQVSERYQSQTQWQLEHLLLAQSLECK